MPVQVTQWPKHHC